ncbi:MAG: hypothetical protein ILP04_02015 [Bacteroidales bacterium]|nr:hypothetical protein [Bacteroidales bacterium]
MSLLFPFFKQPKPRQFDHKPIYYDKVKEERKERYERIRKEMNMAEESEKTVQRDFEKDIRGSFRKAVPGGSSREKMQKFSRIMIIVCVAMLLVVLFMYFRINSMI